MKKGLSVIVPIYNVEQYLERALDSLLKQTYIIDEIICVDDGSYDNSASILREYETKSKNITVIKQCNYGLVNARKKGLSMASYEYCAYLDSDDYIENNMFERMLEVAYKYDADMVTSGIIREYEHYSVVDSEHIGKGFYDRKSIVDCILPNMIDLESFFKLNISNHLTNKLFKTDILKRFQDSVPDEIDVGEDSAVVYPYLLAARSLYIMGENYYHYCIRNDSIMGTESDNDIWRIKRLDNYLKQYFYECLHLSCNLVSQYKCLIKYLLLLRDPSAVVYHTDEYVYPFGKINKKDKLIIYGKGKFGSRIKRYFEEEGFNIVGYIDGNNQMELLSTQYDKVIIAVLVAEVIASIKYDLKGIGICENDLLAVDASLIQM